MAPLVSVIAHHLEQRLAFFDMLEKHTECYCLHDKICTCLHVEVVVPIFVIPYAIKEERKPIIEKEMTRLEKVGIIKKTHTWYGFKCQYHNLTTMYRQSDGQIVK